MIQTMALQQFTLRHQAAQQRVTAGDWDPVEADARLYPWLALALRCGVEPEKLHPQLVDTLADLRRAGHPEGVARHLAALHFCRDDECQAEVAKARDTALATGHPHREALTVLAIRIGCEAHTPERKEAA